MIVTAGDVITSILLLSVVLLVLVGNFLVVVAVATTKKLRTVTNIFIVNLACADFLLGVLVLPFSAVLEVKNSWVFGKIWCQIWLAVDVWMCTASILTLCCISLDRYLAITRPIRYPGLMTSRRAKTLVLMVWLFSFIIGCPPLIGWNDDDGKTVSNNSDNNNTVVFNITAAVCYDDSSGTNACVEYMIIPDNCTHDVLNASKKDVSSNDVIACELTNSRGYRIYAALGSFFIPMFVMVFFYIQIYRAAVNTISAYARGELRTKYMSQSSNGKRHNSMTLRVHRGGKKDTGPIPISQAALAKSRSSDASLVTMAELNSEYYDNTLSQKSSSGTLQTKNSTGNINGYNDAKKHPAIEPLKKALRKKNSKTKLNQCNTHSLSFDSEESSSGDNKNRIHKVDHRPGSPTRSLPSSPTLKASDAQTAFFKANLGERGRKARISIQKPAHAIKLHMQKFNREKKAAKTLAIIVGAFIISWLPFFTIYLIGAFCEDCIPMTLFSIAFWLGYCNSAMNPCVYALFSRDFRFTFRKLLTCNRASRHRLKATKTSDVPAIQLHCPPVDDAKSSSDI